MSGTLGLSGAADAVLVLRRPRYQAEGKLFVTGRDVDEQDLQVRFDSQYGLWQIGDAPRDHLTPGQRKVVDMLAQLGVPITPMRARGCPGSAP